MSDAYLIMLPIAAGLIWAVDWLVDDAVLGLDRRTLLGLAMLVGMVVLGLFVVASLRCDSAPY